MAVVTAQRRYYVNKQGQRVTYHRGMVTIPAEVMDRARMPVGTVIEFVPHPEGLLLRKKQQ